MAKPKAIRAEVIIYDQNNETLMVVNTRLGAIREVKHRLYNLVFRDFFGENEDALKQWKQDNK